MLGRTRYLLGLSRLIIVFDIVTYQRSILTILYPNFTKTNEIIASGQVPGTVPFVVVRI